MNTGLDAIPLIILYVCLSKYLFNKADTDVSATMRVGNTNFLISLDHKLMFPTGKRARISKRFELSNQFFSFIKDGMRSEICSFFNIDVNPFNNRDWFSIPDF